MRIASSLGVMWRSKSLLNEGGDCGLEMKGDRGGVGSEGGRVVVGLLNMFCRLIRGIVFDVIVA